MNETQPTNSLSGAPLNRGARVVVGLSGGVDSAVAALRLVRAGYHVEGLFMKNWEDDDTLLYCAAAEDIAAAEQIAVHLDIPLHRVNFAADYRRQVFSHTLAELRAGRTPNPDILCNRHIKFDLFLRYAVEQLGAEAVATGHYARLASAPEGGQVPQLLRGSDPGKDQSYFLAGVEPSALCRTLFPLGASHKEQVREEARSAGLPNAERPDSTGICFIGKRDFADFLQRYIDPSPGPIVDEHGQTIGHHQGLAFYTLGQRRGLGIGGSRDGDSRPWYVAAKIENKNKLVAVQDHDHPLLLSRSVRTEALHWLAPPPATGSRLEAQVRYRQRAQSGWLEHAEDGAVLFHFDQPQRAATPGQHLVLYAAERCLGGGTIQTAWSIEQPPPTTPRCEPTEETA